MKRRSSPFDSQSRSRMPGKFVSSWLKTSPTVGAFTSTASTPLVNLRRGVGIITFCAICQSRFLFWRLGRTDCAAFVDQGFKIRKFWLDRLQLFELQCFLRLEAVTRDRNDNAIGRLDSSLGDQLLRDRER